MVSCCQLRKEEGEARWDGQPPRAPALALLGELRRLPYAWGAPDPV